MKHITKEKGPGWPICNATCQPGDKLVLAALESDCDACREKCMIAGVAEKGCAPRDAPVWQTELQLTEKKET